MITTEPTCTVPFVVPPKLTLPDRTILAGALLVVGFLVLIWVGLSGTAFAESPHAGTGLPQVTTVPPSVPKPAPLASAAVVPPATGSPAGAIGQAQAIVKRATAAVSAARAQGAAAAHATPALSPRPVPAAIGPITSTSAATPLLAPVRPAAAAPTSPAVVNQCNPPAFPTGAGFEVTCNVSIINTITSTGATHSVVTATACLAASGVIPPSGCTTTVSSSNQLATGVNQCNGIVYGGGSHVTCNVKIANYMPVGTTSSGVTVNQCIGSGHGGVSPVGPTTVCGPGSTTNATVDQCNGSGNGGGAPLRVTCSVSGAASAVPVTVSQCNGSSNGGGSTVHCTTLITDTFISGTTGGGTTGGGTTGGGTTGGGTTGGGTTSVSTGEVTGRAIIVSTRGTTFTGTGPATAGGTLLARSNSPAGALVTGTSLARTGSNTTPMVLLGLLALLLGGLLVRLSGRTRQTPAGN